MYLFVVFILVALDQVTKWWAASTFPLNGPDLALGLGFHFTYTRNTGAAFGILQDATLLLGILSAVVSVAIFIYLLRHARTMPRMQLAALTLILSGAIGNMIDRFLLGFVRDFIHFYVQGFNYPVFNVADMCVVGGAGLLLLSSFFDKRPQEVESEDELTDVESYSASSPERTDTRTDV